MRTCSTCGRKISAAEWEKLLLLGHQVIPPYPPENDPGEVLELRNDTCGSTLAEPMPFTAAELEAAVDEYLELVPGMRRQLAQQLVIERLKSQRR